MNDTSVNFELVRHFASKINENAHRAADSDPLTRRVIVWHLRLALLQLADLLDSSCDASASKPPPSAR